MEKEEEMRGMDGGEERMMEMDEKEKRMVDMDGGGGENDGDGWKKRRG